MRQFSGYGLKHALMAGIRRVIARRDEINRINVFPVADGDTGTNLAFTLAAVLSAVKPMRNAHAGAIFNAAAREAIDGARGNSGAILAQYFQGLNEQLIGQRKIKLDALANACGLAAQSAKEALSQPREGTILSVLVAFGAALKQHAEVNRRDGGSGDLRLAFTQSLKAARVALARTPDQLQVLRDAGVVDAGAAGFVDLLEGIDAFIQTGQCDAASEVDLNVASVDMAGNADAPLDGHRFCTECVISHDDIDRIALRDALEAMPLSSLVCAGTRERVRVHAHVDEPGQLFEICARFGAVSSQKADDTHAQAEAAHARRDRVAIVCDSGADIPADELDRLHIHMIPVRLNIAGHDYLDKVSLAPADFFAAMRNGDVPRTSQPPPGDFRRTFEFLLSHHDDLVYTGIARALSGTLQSAESAVARIGSRHAHCVDTMHASVAQGLITMDAAELAEAGGSAEQILERIAFMRDKTKLDCLIRDITYGVRGGRAPKFAKPLCDWLHAKPTAKNHPTGLLKVRGLMWGEKNLAVRFANSIARRMEGHKTYRILIGHCDCAEDADLMAAAFKTKVPLIDKMWTLALGTAVGAHAGPGSLAVAVQECVPLPHIQSHLPSRSA